MERKLKFDDLDLLEVNDFIKIIYKYPKYEMMYGLMQNTGEFEFKGIAGYIHNITKDYKDYEIRLYEKSKLTDIPLYTAGSYGGFSNFSISKDQIDSGDITILYPEIPIKLPVKKLSDIIKNKLNKITKREFDEFDEFYVYPPYLKEIKK
jgi:hypothetical protein